MRTSFAVVIAGLATLIHCHPPAAVSAAAPQVRGGDEGRGRAVVAGGAYGCTGCHAIPEMGDPQGIVGPPLRGMARRAFIAGQLPNTPEVLVAFLRDPPALVPNTGMPNVRLGLTEARDIAAYLYTLEPSHAP
jgi:cytochrome c2